jgi:hypothetical protein
MGKQQSYSASLARSRAELFFSSLPAASLAGIRAAQEYFLFNRSKAICIAVTATL